MTSAIQTLKDGLKFCEDFLNNSDCSLENKVIKTEQIEEHKKAIKILEMHAGHYKPDSRKSGAKFIIRRS